MYAFLISCKYSRHYLQRKKCRFGIVWGWRCSSAAMSLRIVDGIFVDTNQVTHVHLSAAARFWRVKLVFEAVRLWHAPTARCQSCFRVCSLKKKQNSNAQVKCSTSVDASQPERGSHVYLMVFWVKQEKKFPEWIISSVAWKITQSVDSLQRQRAFWMRCPISQLFSVNYQPTTCQTLTVKMSATKISPSRKKKGAAKRSWDDSGRAASLFSLKSQRAVRSSP